MIKNWILELYKWASWKIQKESIIGNIILEIIIPDENGAHENYANQ